MAVEKYKATKCKVCDKMQDTELAADCWQPYSYTGEEMETKPAMMMPEAGVVEDTAMMPGIHTKPTMPTTTNITGMEGVGECNQIIINAIGLAQAYVPVQPWETPMSEEQGLRCGTIFPGLVQPYVKGSSLRRAKE